MAEDNDRIEVVNENESLQNPSKHKTPSGEPIDKGEDFSENVEEPEELGVAESSGAAPGVPGALQIEQSPEEKVARLEEQLLLLRADMDNLRKRLMRQMDEQVKASNDRLLTEVIEVVDNFERAFEHANEQTDLASMKKGIEMIYNQLVGLLQKHNVSPIKALGEKFDPSVHEAMMQVASGEYPEGTVAVELGKGYRMGDRIVRHSKVGVSTGKSASH